MREKATKLKQTTNKLAPGFIIAGFILLVSFCLSSIVMIAYVAYSNVEGFAALNIGMAILGVLICATLYFNCMRESRVKTDYSTRPFVIMIFVVACSFIAVIFFWCMQGMPQFEYEMVIVGTLKNIFEIVTSYFFWRYVRNILRSESKMALRFDLFAKILFWPSVLYAFINIFVPTIFYIDSDGLYRLVEFFDLSDIYTIYISVISIICLIKSKTNARQKAAILAFIIIPALNYVITFGKTLVVFQSAATLIAIIVMYCFLFSEQSTKLEVRENELDMATDIQRAMLPNNFPYFTKRNEFDIYASMEAAREVGGDFFDFYLLDDDHLCMAVGDVAGKGVPAALFMVSSKTNIARFAKTNMTPAKILTLANKEICSHNEQMLFVSVWLGILEISTGRLVCANAGHEYPAIMMPGEEFEVYKDTHGTVIGAMEDSEYMDYEIELKKGSKVFIYTDGVVEATNKKKELFGQQKMISALNNSIKSKPKEVLENVRKAVDTFADGEEQSDDITMLCLEYYGAKIDDKDLDITLEADVSMLHEVESSIRRKIENVECSEPAIMELEIVVEEIFVNIASYAYAPYKGNVTIKTELVNNNESIRIQFIDSGRQYNPLVSEDPDISASVEDRAIGGLGIFMTKKLVDDISYEYKNMQNILTIVKKLT